jgi:hypothetical protein
MNAVTRSTIFVQVLMTLLFASAANATTLTVNCGVRGGLNSIGAALKVLQSAESRGPNTINVSGACRENVVIQSLDRLTLNAAPGASITDKSGGTASVIDVEDSRDVAINGFTVNAGPGPDFSGVTCGDYSTCRLSRNVIQGGGGSGFTVFGQAQATLNGDTLQNNKGAGLFLRSGARVRGGPFTSSGNGQGINIGRQAFAYITATIEQNTNQGVVAQFQSTLELTGSISGNGGQGAIVREGSVARFTTATINGNGAAGVLIQDLSMVTFNGTTVTGNGGGTDVVCDPQYSATRGTPDVGSGTTNCVEQREEGLFATQIQLDSTEMPAGNPTLVRAFIPTGSDSEVCFVNLGDSGFYLGTFAPTTCIRRTYLGQKGLVVILSTTGWELPGDFVMRVSVYQKGATSYGQPIPWND